MEIRALAPLPVEVPDELFPEEPLLDVFPELLEPPEVVPPVERFTSLLVSFVMVIMPTEPSLDRLLFF